MNPCELTASITALANLLACRLSDDELNLLAVALTQLAHTLITLSTNRSLLSNQQKAKNCFPPQKE